MWQRRDAASSDDVIIVGCRLTNERWRLTCVGGAWTGDVIGNCSTGIYLFTDYAVCTHGTHEPKIDLFQR